MPSYGHPSGCSSSAQLGMRKTCTAANANEFEPAPAMAMLLVLLLRPTIMAAALSDGGVQQLAVRVNCPANISTGVQLGAALPTTHCGENCTTSASCCNICAADVRCRAWVWRRGDPEHSNPLNSCKIIVQDPGKVTRRVVGDAGIVCGIMPPAPPPPPPPPPCSSHKTNATCSSRQLPPKCIWNSTTHTCALPCGVTKQKSIYLAHNFNPPIEDSPATDISIEVDWNSTADLMRYGRQTGTNPGIYASSPIHTHDGISGYFGVQVFYGDNHGNHSSNGSFLFSTWDALRAHKKADPKDYGCDPLPRWAANLTWCMRHHSFPLSPNCHRHCQDCGLHPGWHNTTGTQCGVALNISEGDGFRIRATRTAAITSYEYPAGHILNGSAWVVTAQRVRQNGITTTPGPVITVGRQFWEGTFGGIARIGSFHEHIGCIPCDAFYESEVRRGPWIHAPVPRAANVSYTESTHPVCTLHSVEVMRRADGTADAAQIRTGPGCCSST